MSRKTSPNPNVYDEFYDDNGNRVRIVESEGMHAERIKIGTLTPRHAYVPAELDVAMATRVRDALTVFIGEQDAKPEPAP